MTDFAASEHRTATLEEAASAAVAAATTALRAHGIARPSVVVNFAWKNPSDPQTYAVGTAVPKRHRAMLADSLAQSVEEASS